MYGWLWRVLPGGLVGKLLGSLVLFLGAVALLFLFVFPRLEPLLPFSDVTVDTGSTPTPSPATGTPIGPRAPGS